MSREALDMCKHLTTATVRGDVNGQYHWASLIVLDALANGAKGPEVMTPAELMECRLYAEDAIEEARR